MILYGDYCDQEVENRIVGDASPAGVELVGCVEVAMGVEVVRWPP